MSLPLAIRAPALLDEGPTFMTSFNSRYCLKTPISKYSHAVGRGGDLSIWGNLIQSITESFCIFLSVRMPCLWV